MALRNPARLKYSIKYAGIVDGFIGILSRREVASSSYVSARQQRRFATTSRVRPEMYVP